jgi:hypothetical protein
VALVISSLLLATLAGNPSSANAADLSRFDPGFIIADNVFYSGNTMNSGEIQTFLNSKVGACAAGSVCLKNFAQNTFNRPADAMCAAYVGGQAETAAKIIEKVALACSINPRVLLVMLQKEQGLVLASAPGNPETSWTYKAAMGYACPDTAPCDARYFGFYNQVYMAAWQLKRYSNPPGTSRFFTWYPVGSVTNVRFHPNESCGSDPVLIRNAATAALYYYTPYQPNSSALAAGYGTGDACGSYGNRNFFAYFTDWFGSTTANMQTRDQHSPLGAVELISRGPGSVKVDGWAFDPETATPISIHVYLGGPHDAGGTWGGAYSANLPNVFVSRTYPSYGPNHGFSFSFSQLGGSTQACIYAINVGAGSHTLIDCPMMSPATGLPFGNFEGAWMSGLSASVQGWLIDPDTVEPVRVHAYIGGQYGVGRWGGEFFADRPRGDVTRYFPLYNNRRGLSALIPVGVGTTPVCLYAMDGQISGASTFLGCRSVSSASGPPIGSLDSIAASVGSIRVNGWAFDPDTVQPIDLHVYVDGRWGGSYNANAPRPDVGRAYPGYGDNHGFVIDLQRGLNAGATNNVCVFGINVQAGFNSLIGCRSVQVPGGMPFGNLEGSTVSGDQGVLSGWVVDPDTIEAVAIHAYVNGRWGGSFLANQTRLDVGRAYPNYGNDHGFSASVPLQPGVNQVCLYAINIGAGATNPLLGCRVLSR